MNSTPQSPVLLPTSDILNSLSPSSLFPPGKTSFGQREQQMPQHMGLCISSRRSTLGDGAAVETLHRMWKSSDINVGQRRETSALRKGKSKNQKRDLYIQYPGCADKAGHVLTRTHTRAHTHTETTNEGSGEGSKDSRGEHNENGKGTAGSLT